MAEKIRAAIGQLRFAGTSLDQVTASFGVAALDRSTADLDSLIKHADAAMYEAKAGGRDRSVAWKGTDEPKPMRRRVLKAGRIVFNARTSAIDCTVRTLADNGAGVDVTSTLGFRPTLYCRSVPTTLKARVGLPPNRKSTLSSNSARPTNGLIVGRRLLLDELRTLSETGISSVAPNPDIFIKTPWVSNDLPLRVRGRIC